MPTRSRKINETIENASRDSNNVAHHTDDTSSSEPRLRKNNMLGSGRDNGYAPVRRSGGVLDDQDREEIGLKPIDVADEELDSEDEHGHASDHGKEADSILALPPKDKINITLLIVLYLLQGVPVGLAFGSVPFLLKSTLSYGEIGIFTLSSYPYSLKLLWSPIVDAVFLPRFGRRKSWIVPIQMIIGILFLWLGFNVNDLLANASSQVYTLTATFFILIFFCATQDIAVDGWALTLLSKDNLSYASTAQTIGLNTGYFLSFTIFLAFNSPEFSNKYFRTIPQEQGLLSLGSYLIFWAFAYFGVTIWLMIFKKEDMDHLDDADMNIKSVYKTMWSIFRLKHVRLFLSVLMVAKIGFQANEAVTALKMIEKGLNKEDLALTVLLDFPVQIVFGYYAAKWSSGKDPLRPWLLAYIVRLSFAVLAMPIVAGFPPGGMTNSYFALIVISTVSASCASTVQFVGLSAFHTQIADPLIGGTYMTLLNTVSNLGGTWPRYFVLQAVDVFTSATCTVPSMDLDIKAQQCVSESAKDACKELGGQCVIHRDGYYIVNTLCIITGALLLAFFIWPRMSRLQNLPKLDWRVKRT